MNSDRMRPGAVVVGRNYCNILAMTRALGLAGYDVEVLRVYRKAPKKIHPLGSMKPDAKSRYVKGFYECVTNEDLLKVVKCLEEHADAGQKKVLLPVDDYSAYVVDEYMDLLKEDYWVPNIGQKAGEINRFMDKHEQKEAAKNCGLPMLKSVLIRSQDGKFTIPEDTVFPCFIKPNISMKSTKASMSKCQTREELEAKLTRLAEKADFEMLAEEFADIKTEYSVLGVSVEGAVTAPAVFKVLEGGHRERKGVTLVGETVDASRFQGIIEQCAEYVRTLKYTGIFDVDLLETTDGRIYFIELNFRAGASMHAFTMSGVNLPKIYADGLVNGEKIERECTVRETGKRFISEKVLLEEYARSDAKYSKVRQYMKDADIYFIKDVQDMKPYQYFKRYYLAAMLMRIPYRIRDYRTNVRKGTKED